MVLAAECGLYYFYTMYNFVNLFYTLEYIVASNATKQGLKILPIILSAALGEKPRRYDVL